jgi:hypothetical protein
VQAYERREGPPSLLVFDVQLRPDAQARMRCIIRVVSAPRHGMLH